MGPARGSEAPTRELMQALLIEQRRTNRLLQGFAWAGAGFLLGAMLAKLLLPWIHA
jgi:ubiquinone biosynthesis protein